MSYMNPELVPLQLSSLLGCEKAFDRLDGLPRSILEAFGIGTNFVNMIRFI